VDAFTPKSIVCLREGYSAQIFLHDLLAGLTVGVIALPLAMALAIASGTTEHPIRPEQGLYTAIIAGTVIALLSGSRVSVAGPTAAFAPLLAGIVVAHGYEGLVMATLMAGVILILMGVFKLGGMIKFIPYPVTTGFTAGIAVSIFSGQVKDFLGLRLPGDPREFIDQWAAYFHGLSTINWWTAGFGGGSLLVLILMRRFMPRVPGALVVVGLSASLVGIFHLDKLHDVVTIGSKFNGIPSHPPTLHT